MEAKQAAVERLTLQETELLVRVKKARETLDGLTASVDKKLTELDEINKELEASKARMRKFIA
jgi:hypothetical protein